MPDIGATIAFVRASTGRDPDLIAGKPTDNRPLWMIAAFGARMARGCTSGQALTGGASLALGSWAFMLAVFAAVYGLAYFFRKEWI